jgi:hypothetical protein
MTPYSSLTVFKLLTDFVDQHPEDRITVRALVDHVGEQGLMFLLLIFALFCAVPLTIPGIHVFLAMPLFYVTVQLMIGRRSIWLPDKILNATLPRQGFVVLVEKSDYWFNKLDNWLKPRLEWSASPTGYRIAGAVAFFITCIIVIPLPLTNVVPSLTIAVMALAILCRDGLAALLAMTSGILWCLAWLVLVAFIGWAGMKGIYALLFS